MGWYAEFAQAVENFFKDEENMSEFIAWKKAREQEQASMELKEIGG